MINVGTRLGPLARPVEGDLARTVRAHRLAERVTARLSPQSPAREGAASRLWVDGERLYLFDQHTDRCVSWPRPQSRPVAVGDLS